MSTNTRLTGVRRILIAIIVTTLAMAAGIWAALAVLEHKSVPDDLAATRFPAAREIAAFSLLDHNNQLFDNNALKQRWSFVFFGYTHCPDVCPTTLSVLNSVSQKLADVDADVRFVFLSVDPERDTPAQLAQFVSYFNDDFIGVTGTPEGIAEITRQLGVIHSRVVAEQGASGYLVDHTASVFLFDPDGRYHAVFTPPLSADALAGDFRKMLQAYQ